MKLIKRSVLKEEYNETAEKPTISKDAAYKQAILTAIGSETGAWNEYNTILEMESAVSKDLVEHFHNTIEDIRNEEMKHVGQLTEKVSQISEMKDAYEAGKKEAEEGAEESLDKTNTDNKNEKIEDKKEDTENKDIKEAVALTESVIEKIPDNTRRFDSDTIFEIIINNFDLTDDTETIIYKLFNDGEELTAEEVDEKLAKIRDVLHISPENMEILENIIINSKDPVVERIKEFESDINSDIGLLRDMLEKANSKITITYLQRVIDKLEAIEYNGEKDIQFDKFNDFN